MPNYKAKFNNHNRVDVLQEGDILLKQNLDGLRKDKVGNVISFFQKVTVSSGENLPGAYLSGHAAIYVGQNQIAEATSAGVGLTNLSAVMDTRYIVYRSNYPQVGTNAAEFARMLTNRHETGGKKFIFFGKKNTDGEYSLFGAFASLATTKKVGKRGALLLSEVMAFCLGGEDGGLEGRRVVPDFFCSQFVFVVHELAMFVNQRQPFALDPYSVDPKFYHKLLDGDVEKYEFLGKYIHVHSDESWREQCETSVLQAITSYENLKLNQRFQSLRSTSDASDQAVVHLKNLARACDMNDSDDNYEMLLIASLYYTRSLSELSKFLPYSSYASLSDIQVEQYLKPMYGSPLGLKSTFLSELDRTMFFGRLRSVRKNWVNAMQ